MSEAQVRDAAPSGGAKIEAKDRSLDELATVKSSTATDAKGEPKLKKRSAGKKEAPLTVTAYKCDSCDELIPEDDVGGPLYGCSECGDQFTRENSADGDSNRCPNCNKFGAKDADATCPNCETEVEEVEAAECETCNKLVEADDLTAHSASCQPAAQSQPKPQPAVEPAQPIAPSIATEGRDGSANGTSNAAVTPVRANRVSPAPLNSPSIATIGNAVVKSPGQPKNRRLTRKAPPNNKENGTVTESSIIGQQLLWTEEDGWNACPALVRKVEEFRKVEKDCETLSQKIDRLRWRFTKVIKEMRAMFPNQVPKGQKCWDDFCREVLRRDRCTTNQDLAALKYVQGKEISVEDLIEKNMYLPPVAKVARLASIKDEAKRDALHEALFAGKFEGKLDDFENQVKAAKGQIVNGADDARSDPPDPDYVQGDHGVGSPEKLGEAISRYWGVTRLSFMVNKTQMATTDDAIEEIRGALEVIGAAEGRHRIGFAVWIESSTGE